MHGLWLGEETVRIGFVAEDLLLDNGVLRPSGCSYYRCLLPKNVLHQEMSAFGPPAFTAEHGFGVRLNKTTAEFGFDTIVMKMLMSRWVPKHMQIAQDLGQKIIVDVDDHYDFIHDDNIASKNTDPENNAIRNREHYRAVIQQADLVTVSTPELYNYYKDQVRDIRLVRNGINPDQFTKRDVKNRKPVLGWAGAMNWRSGDAETARAWLPELLEEHDLMFHHAGHMPDSPKFWEKAGVPEERMILSPMKPLHKYADMLDFDIGVVLLSDIPFNRAKSTIKGLEYAATNIPFVAQGLPEYARLAELGVGRVANSPAEWKQHITELLDYKTRKREAAIQRNLVIKEHSIQARAHEWKAIFEEGIDNILPIRTMRVSYLQA